MDQLDASSAAVDPSYLVSLESLEQTLLIPELGPDCFITAHDPGMDEDKIQAATMSFRTRPTPRDEKVTLGGAVIEGDVRVASGFVAKCKYQITNFHLLVRKETGEEVIVTYNPANRGDNFENERLYARLMTSSKLFQLVDGFLDFVAGRGGPAAEHFETLKNERPELLRTS